MFGASCDWNFPQGVTTNLGYWADSSFGDQSDEAHASMSVDSVAPSLTLTIPAPNGQNGWFKSGPVTASASATDASSGVAGVDINGSGPSFTASSDGVYTLAASATDKAGNTASTSGTIRLDSTPPTLSVSPAMPDGANNWYVSPAVLTAAASDVTSGLASTQYQVDGGAWQNGASISEGADGTQTIVFRATDNAGNNTSAAPVSVSVDRTPPFPDATLTPDTPNGSNGWYNSAVTVTANSSDATSGLASQAISLDGSTWMPALTLSTDGVYTVQVSAKDNAGNTASATKTVKLDSTPPAAAFQVPAADGANGWYVNPVTVSVSGTDATSGVASQLVSLDGASWSSSLTLSEDGVSSVHGRVTDNAGNTTSITRTVPVDRTPPVPQAALDPASSDGANGWFVSPVTITADSSDVTSGIASQGVSLDGTNWKPAITLSTDGDYSVKVQAQDAAGNTASTTKTIHLDRTPPTAGFQAAPADGDNGWYVSPVTVSAVGTDATSGVARAQVSLDGSTWAPSLTLSADGVYTVQSRVTDRAGNATHSSQTFQIDSTPPVIGTPVLTGTTGQDLWYTSRVGVSAPATDATSGVASTQYSVDRGAWQTIAPTLPDGNHTVQIKVTDKAGNTSTASVSAHVDAIPPVSAFISPARGSTTQISGNGVVHLSGSSSDATSGVAEAQISLDGGTTWQPLPLGSGGAWSEDWNSLRENGTYTIEVRASDNAGNQEQHAKVTLVVGNQVPSASITPIWFDFAPASVSFKSGSLPIAGACITVADPSGRWPSAVFDYRGSNLPGRFAWLGKMGDGSIGYGGKYKVTVRVWDSLGNTGTASGWVIIPLPPARPTATVAAPAVIPPALTFQPPTQVPPTPIPIIPAKGKPVPVKAPVPRPAQTIVRGIDPISLWPALALGAFLAVLSASSFSNKKPLAYREL
jgi:hypothetical protein